MVIHINRETGDDMVGAYVTILAFYFACLINLVRVLSTFFLFVFGKFLGMDSCTCRRLMSYALKTLCAVHCEGEGL